MQLYMHELDFCRYTFGSESAFCLGTEVPRLSAGYVVRLARAIQRHLKLRDEHAQDRSLVPKEGPG